MLLASSSFADIPLPPAPVAESSVDVNVSGKDAVELYDSLKVEVLRGSAMRTKSSTYKVFRSGSGETQIVCEKFIGGLLGPNPHATEQSYCKISKSTNGKPLAKFRPVIRMG